MLTGFKALSADIESKRVLKIHFDHEVTDADRAALVDAINSWIEVKRLRAVMQEVSDEMKNECMRDGGLYWLPASSHRIDDWNAKLECAVEHE